VFSKLFNKTVSQKVENLNKIIGRAKYVNSKYSELPYSFSFSSKNNKIPKLRIAYKI